MPHTRALSRRQFIARSVAATASGPLIAGSASRQGAAPLVSGSGGGTLQVATNTYPWGTFASRDGGKFVPHSDEALAAIASSGCSGYEPIIADAGELEGLGARLRAHGLEMQSIYVNSSLHDESAAASIQQVMAIARRAVAIGTRIVVTNPAPIRWGGPENKTDLQIRSQAAALDRLGRQLREIGVTLAYHNHDAELRLGAREFHHMLTATAPAHVKFCLDAHWLFRGCGDSQVALFDAVEHYGDRIVELHLRQSRGGVWTEVFSAQGDVDYARLSTWLQRHDIRARLTLEQAVESGSPKTMDSVAAHRRGLAVVRDLFKWMV